MSLEFSLLKKQHEFIISPERLVIFRAGIRSGKTHILSIWAIHRAMQNRKVILLEPIRAMCTDVLLPCLKEHLDAWGLIDGRDYSINLTGINISFKCGGKILIRSAESAERLRGITADDGGIDEFASLKTDYAYKILVGRLSKSDNAQIRLTSSPSLVFWIRDLETKRKAKVIHQTTLENYFLPQSYIDDMINQYGVGSKWYRQEILGELVSMDDGIFDTSKLNKIPYHRPSPASRFVRAWDTASAAKTSSDYTAGCLMSVDSSGNYIIHEITRLHGAFASIQSNVINAMQSDPHGTIQLFENTSAGQIIMSVLQADQRCQGIPIVPVQAITDKITRALPLSGKVSAGAVSICEADWNKNFVDEMESFGPKCPHDDQIDAASYAFNHLSIPPARLTTFNF